MRVQVICSRALKETIMAFWIMPISAMAENNSQRKRFLFFWKWWRIERWLNRTYQAVLLEIKIPKEIKFGACQFCKKIKTVWEREIY